MSPLNGPHRSLVTQTWPPFELSQFFGNQQSGLGISEISALASVDLSFICDEVTTPLKLPSLIQCSGTLGTQLPSLSPMVTWPVGLTHRPLSPEVMIFPRADASPLP